jgi:hypothetical protein
MEDLIKSVKGPTNPRGEYLMGHPRIIDQITQKPEIGEGIQRPLNPEKVKEIYESQKKEIAKGGILVLDALTLCKYRDKYYLIDGQHRLSAYLLLEKEGYRIPKILCISINVSNEAELKHFGVC